MKKVILILIFFIAVSCKKEAAPVANIHKTPVELGKEIFDGKGNCVACHQPEQKVIGPSIHDIAKIYNDKNASITNFLQGNADPIVDPSQYEVMKTNFAITKSMPEEELQAIEAYMKSFLK